MEPATITAMIILAVIIAFSLATAIYSSGEAAFILTLIAAAALFFWDLGNQGALLLKPLITIGGWLQIKLWTALLIYLMLLAGYVFGAVGKAIVLIVIMLIIFHHLGLLSPLVHGDIGALKEAIELGGGNV